MNNLFLLIKINVLASFGGSRKSGEATKESRRKAYMPLLMLVLCVFLAYSIYEMANTIVSATGRPEVALYMGANLATLLVFIFGIYKVPSYLFQFSDYDLLMSMPIKRSTIMASKIAYLYGSDLLYSLIVCIPMFVVYSQYTGAGIVFWVKGIVSLLFLPCAPFVVCALLSFLLAQLASLLNAKNLVMLIGSLLVVLAYMVAVMWLNGSSTADPEQVVPVMESINSVNIFSPMFTQAIMGSFAELLLYVAVEVVLLAAFVLIFAKSFASINASMNETRKGKRVKASHRQVRTPLQSLYRKELKSFFSSYMYVMNSGFGLILLAIAAIVLLFIGDPLAAVPELEGQSASLWTAIIAIVISFTVVLSNTCAPSISLEGKRFWIIKSMPVEMRDVLKSKLLVNLTLSLPVVVFALLMVVISGLLPLANVACLLALSVSLALFTPLIGLISNLLFPRMDYKNDITALKSGGGVLLGILFGFLAVILVGALIFTLGLMLPGGDIIISLCLAATFLVVDLLLWLYLRGGGARKLSRLPA